MDMLFAARERQLSGNHEFDMLCRELGIEHRPTKPMTPKTNGVVERLHGRMSDGLKSIFFNQLLDLQQTLARNVALYNDELPQSAAKGKTTAQILKDRYHSGQKQVAKLPYDCLEHDNQCRLLRGTGE